MADDSSFKLSSECEVVVSYHHSHQLSLSLYPCDRCHHCYCWHYFFVTIIIIIIVVIIFVTVDVIIYILIGFYLPITYMCHTFCDTLFGYSLELHR